ncbi:hypothetical protein EJ04DRAFT_566948 [Polyplosphaeria fusca]|uniref:Uncharacterized protein n=1 Tax=Polyplosphaeria fusca TaxID=682080 RepID=A0A9P4QPJ8_9PLEO|nr:hypothetical protein EJ04DRAFT_566948 [Polyplosphaeria fusca]
MDNSEWDSPYYVNQGGMAMNVDQDAEVPRNLDEPRLEPRPGYEELFFMGENQPAANTAEDRGFEQIVAFNSQLNLDYLGTPAHPVYYGLNPALNTAPEPATYLGPVLTDVQESNTPFDQELDNNQEPLLYHDTELGSREEAAALLSTLFNWQTPTLADRLWATPFRISSSSDIPADASGLSNPVSPSFQENPDPASASEGVHTRAPAADDADPSSAPEDLYTPRIMGPMQGIPLWDFEISGPGAVNFTAVEIIVFLPKWFYNHRIGARFLNNGMTAVIHVHILRTHRECDPERGIDFHRNTMNGRYRVIMRRNGFPEWTRQSHVVPEGWNHADISVNGRVSDRLRNDSSATDLTPIAFTDLLKGVVRVPRGKDAADLTRAIQYAESHLRGSRPYMFPDHLQEILNIIGRTSISEDYTDIAAVARWKAHLDQTNKLQKQQQQQRSESPGTCSNGTTAHTQH